MQDGIFVKGFLSALCLKVLVTIGGTVRYRTCSMSFNVNFRQKSMDSRLSGKIELKLFEKLHIFCPYY